MTTRAQLQSKSIDELREVAQAAGIDTDGLQKSKLIAALMDAGEVKATPGDSVQMQRAAADRKPNPPRAGDFVDIRPGQSWTHGNKLQFPGAIPDRPNTIAFYSIVKPGEFRITLTYTSQELNSLLAKGIPEQEKVEAKPH